MSDGEGNKNQGLTSKIQIPYFDPASNKISAEAWIAYVDLARESAGYKTATTGAPPNVVVTKTYNWTEPQTCTNAMLLLQGTANKWGVHLLKSKSPALEKWSNFRKLFKERFIQSLTLNEKMNLRDLRMTAIESCRDFYDRCSNNIELFYENEWEQIEETEDIEANHSTPWEDPGKAITKIMVTRSETFLKITNLDLKNSKRVTLLFWILKMKMKTLSMLARSTLEVRKSSKVVLSLTTKVAN